MLRDDCWQAPMRAVRWSTGTGTATAFAVLAAIVALDIVVGPEIVLSASYAVAALVAAVTVSVRTTTLVAVASLVLSALAGIWNDNFATLDWTLRMLITVGLGALAVQTARVRVSRERDLRRMTVIADAAQRALLRAMPTAVGSVGFAARYVSATAEALVGGDLYEVAESPYGVRVVVGDVRGKGLDAVQLAATVLGAFRRSAFTQPSLTEVAADLDAVVRAVAGDEDFVTALLAEFHEDHTVTLVNCGHHPPLLVTESATAGLLSCGEPQPPLGLSPAPTPFTTNWPEGSRLLIYTDGLVEARDGRGEFFPLDDYAPALREGSLDDALDRLTAGLVAYAGNKVNDDMALVLAEHHRAS